MNSTFRAFLGECIGTFMMCFFGIGAVSVATLGGTMTGNYQVGMIWGITIAIAIFTTRHLSAAHFNPAVTFAMAVTGNMKWREVPIYLIGQFVGAIIAAALLWVLFADSVAAVNLAAGVSASDPPLAGSASSSWRVNYTNNGTLVVGTGVAALAEGAGVFVLVFVIFSLTSGENTGRPSGHLAPLFIGLTVTIIIGTVGPITDAGLNPARDLGPRIVGALVGLGGAFSPEILLVYTVAPLVGGMLAGLFYKYVVGREHRMIVVENKESEDFAADAMISESDKTA
ncbi:MAG: aquaporin [Eggerthellaceae bacterium]|nr:aquaporin [Eggerthellaceae bacterium]